MYLVLKLKQFPETSKAKFRKITSYYTNISFFRIRVLGLFVVDVVVGAASQRPSEASLSAVEHAPNHKLSLEQDRPPAP